MQAPKVGEFWIADTKGKTHKTARNTNLDFHEPVKITWVSTDARVVEGHVMRGKRDKVTLNRGRLIRQDEPGRWYW